jgi:hypothetical protein
MKAKQVNEFEQGGNPYDTMNLGKYDNDYDFDNPQDNDRIELTSEIIENSITIRTGGAMNGSNEWITREELEAHIKKRVKLPGTIYIYPAEAGAWLPEESWIKLEKDHYLASKYEQDWINPYWISNHQNIFKKLR